MTRDLVNLQYPEADTSDSVALLAPETSTVAAANGATIKNAFACKDNTLCVVVNNTATSTKEVILKAGDYANAILGDLAIAIPASSEVIIKVENPSRFELQDGSLDVDFEAGFEGTVYAFGKRAGLKPVS